MLFYTSEFAMYMDANGIKYTEQKENALKVTYSGENLGSIPVYVIFDKDNDPLVQVKCWNIANFKNNEAAAIAVCNALNCQYRWVKFYVDSDNDIVASIDAMFDKESCGEICMFLVRRVVSIVDDAYPQIAKARWA